MWLACGSCNVACSRGRLQRPWNEQKARNVGCNRCQEFYNFASSADHVYCLKLSLSLSRLQNSYQPPTSNLEPMSRLVDHRVWPEHQKCQAPRAGRGNALPLPPLPQCTIHPRIPGFLPPMTRQTQESQTATLVQNGLPRANASMLMRG
jgi:hypothetical protein